MEKILIIQLGRMGDCTQTLPLLKALKAERADCVVTLLCVREFSEIFQRSSFIDRFVYLSAAEVKTIKESKEAPEIPELSENYHLVVNLTNNAAGAFLTRISRAESKSGIVESPYPEGRVKGAWAKYLFCSQKSRRTNLFNLVDMQMRMAGISPSPVRGYMNVSPLEIDQARDLLKAEGHSGQGHLIAFQPGANQLHRAWPVESFVSLARTLTKRPEVRIVLLGSKAESKLGEFFSDLPSHRVVDLMGKTKMSELPAILTLCDLIVSNDTGTIHIAAAVNTQALGIYFSTAYFAETAPYGEGHTIVQPNLPCSPCDLTDMCEKMPCRDAIGVEIVAKTAQMLLENSKILEGDASSVFVYRSSFLSNGALVYAPVAPLPIPLEYMEALIWRTGWERVFGMKPDRAFLSDCLSRVDRPEAVAEMLSEMESELVGLAEQYVEAMTLARLIENELSKGSPDTDRIAGMSDKLRAIDTRIASSAHPMIKYYHMLEMTDIDYEDFHTAIRQRSAAYSRLNTMIGTFIHAVVLGI